MSENMIEYHSHDAVLKNHKIILTGYGPDNIEATVEVESEDISSLYQMSLSSFISTYGENGKILAELWTAIKGIGITHE